MSFIWRRRNEGLSTGNDDAVDLARYHLEPEPPAEGSYRVIWQSYMHFASPDEVASRARAWMRDDWRRQVFHMMKSDGRLYRWDSGAFFTDLVLSDRECDEGEFQV